eukprot:gene5769-9590_t
MYKQVNDEKIGNYLVATKDIPRGQILITEAPICHVVSDRLLETHCHYCLQFLEKKLRCPKCKFAYYCSGDCQKKDWANHKYECKSILKSTPYFPNESTRLMSKILQKKTTDKDAYQKFLNFVSHADQKKDDEALVEMSYLVLDFFPATQENKPKLEEVFENFCRFECNNFGIMDEEQNTLGTGVYLASSFLNHSCQPNCVAMFNKNEIIIRCIENIKKGDQLMISYVEFASSSPNRNEILQSQYCFECFCQKCQLKLNDDLLGGTICSECSSILDKEYFCQKCEKKENQKKLESQFYKSIELSGNLEYDKCYEIQKKILSPYHENIFQTLYFLTKKSLDSQEFHNAVIYLTLSLPIYEMCYPKYSPLLGQQYFLLGNMHFICEDFVNALTYFRKAMKVFKKK